MSEMKVKLKPFNVPNFVIQQTGPGKRQEGFQSSPSYSMNEVPEEVLIAMCKEFTDSVLMKHHMPRD